MSQSPLITLAAGALGAVVGLVAPFISTSLAQRGASRDGQRIVANDILDLLSDSTPIDELLGGRSSPARRKLYILGIRLRDKAAREACERLVVEAGQDGSSEEDLFPAWSHTIQEVSRISRGSR